MEQDVWTRFLEAKQELRKRLRHGDIAETARKIWGKDANRQPVSMWINDDKPWPGVDARNYQIMKQVVDKREAKTNKELSAALAA